MIPGAVIPPERMIWSVSFTDHGTSVTSFSGTNSTNPAGGITPVRTQTQRIVSPIARVALHSGSANDNARLPGWGNGTRTTRLNVDPPPVVWSDWKTLRTAL